MMHPGQFTTEIGRMRQAEAIQRAQQYRLAQQRGRFDEASEPHVNTHRRIAFKMVAIALFLGSIAIVA